MQSGPSIQENLLKRKKETRQQGIQMLLKRIVRSNSSCMSALLILCVYVGMYVHIYLIQSLV